MNIISIDPSKKCTGIFTIIDGEELSLSIDHSYKDQQEDMLQDIYYFFTKILENNKYDIGFVEGYWLSNKRGFTLEPEIVGVIKLVFAIAEVPLITIPIPTWKAIVRIKINKKKMPDEYLQAIKIKYNKEFMIIDEADAFLIYVAADYIMNNVVTNDGAVKVKKRIKEVLQKGIRNEDK